MNILWFGDCGRKNSFSRITESVLPLLVKKNNVILLSPNKSNIEGIKSSYAVGDPLNEDFGFNEFNKNVSNGSEMQRKMKYTIVQLGYLRELHSIDILLIVGGQETTEWFARLIHQGRSSFRCKIWAWVPFDSIPSYESIQNILQLDGLITMTPIMKKKLEQLANIGNTNITIDFAPHGVSEKFKKLNLSPKNIIRKSSQIKFWKKPIKKILPNDIIILNANQCNERKRLDLTLQAFSKCSENHPNIKLWLHTNVESKLFKKLMDKYRLLVQLGKIIISCNGISDEKLNYIYNTCQIGIQTSTGEGWSLTNYEHASIGGLQVVPNFLATKYHFSNTEHILFPVEHKIIQHSNYYETQGIGKIEDIQYALNCAILRIKEKNFPNSLQKITWNDASDKLERILKTSRTASEVQ